VFRHWFFYCLSEHLNNSYVIHKNNQTTINSLYRHTHDKIAVVVFTES